MISSRPLIGLMHGVEKCPKSQKCQKVAQSAKRCQSSKLQLSQYFVGYCWRKAKIFRYITLGVRSYKELYLQILFQIQTSFTVQNVKKKKINKIAKECMCLQYLEKSDIFINNFFFFLYMFLSIFKYSCKHNCGYSTARSIKLKHSERICILSRLLT